MRVVMSARVEKLLLFLKGKKIKRFYFNNNNNNNNNNEK